MQRYGNKGLEDIPEWKLDECLRSPANRIKKEDVKVLQFRVELKEWLW